MLAHNDRGRIGGIEGKEKKLKELNLERLSGKHIHQMLGNCFT